MPSARVASSSPLVQRTCLRCGYRGEELQRHGELAAYRCPDCGQDLYARPPRSYAEMEGLSVEPPPVSIGAPGAPASTTRPVAGHAAPRRGWLSRVLSRFLARFGVGARAAPTRAPVVNAPRPKGPSSLPR